MIQRVFFIITLSLACFGAEMDCSRAITALSKYYPKLVSFTKSRFPGIYPDLQPLYYHIASGTRPESFYVERGSMAFGVSVVPGKNKIEVMFNYMGRNGARIGTVHNQYIRGLREVIDAVLKGLETRAEREPNTALAVRIRAAQVKNTTLGEMLAKRGMESNWPIVTKRMFEVSGVLAGFGTAAAVGALADPTWLSIAAGAGVGSLVPGVQGLMGVARGERDLLVDFVIPAQTE